MVFKHLFKVKLNWFLKPKNEYSNPKKYYKNHTIYIDGKSNLELSAAKAFKGDEKCYNPEDLLLSSIASCHMMSYLYVCLQNNIEVLSYSDVAEATLEVKETGEGKIVEVRLYPKVIICSVDKIDLALKLHKKANKLCFIANSCNFPIKHFPICEV